ncbi:hypothetical protein ABZP36_015432 [Zizania latifolia]
MLIKCCGSGEERKAGIGDGGSGEERKAVVGDGGSGEERKAVVRVLVADMPPTLQQRAFHCARDQLAKMPHSSQWL